MASPGPPRPLRILVVDNVSDTTESMALWLRLRGHDVRTAGGGPEALTLAAGYRPDVVFLDVVMPGMDGWEVARRLRQDPGLAGLRIVCVTGLGRHADRRRSRESGCDEHWVKPIDPDRLAKLLESERRGKDQERG